MTPEERKDIRTRLHNYITITEGKFAGSTLADFTSHLTGEVARHRAEFVRSLFSGLTQRELINTLTVAQEMEAECKQKTTTLPQVPKKKK